MRKLIIYVYTPVIYIIASFSFQLFCQSEVERNLIPNGSFENFKKKTGTVKSAIPWGEVGTVDLYREPLSNDTSRFKGARTGDTYIGLRFQKNYKEYIQVKLAEPLHRGYKYKFEMYIRLAFWSNAALKSFSVAFTKAGFHASNIFDKTCRIDTISKKHGIVGNYEWLRISAIYQSDGGEKYMTFGNFADKVQKDMEGFDNKLFSFKEAYYFVDDISLIWQKPKGEEIKTVIVGSETFEKDSVLEVKTDLKVGEKVSLKNIHFEKNHYYITPESFSELNKLVQYMLRHPKMEIRINGHSDNSGLEFKNLRISEQRAKAVFEYLIGKGVQNKMYFKGFGSKQAIAENTSEEGKAKNRRVEFEIIKQ